MAEERDVGLSEMSDFSVSYAGGRDLGPQGINVDLDGDQLPRTPSTASDAYQPGGAIKRRLTDDGFEDVQDVPWDDLSTTRALDLCKKYVLRPYHTFLKVITWRAFRSDFATSQPIYKKILNVIYPSFMFIMLVITCVCQVMSCLSRTRAMPPLPVGDYFVLDCQRNFITGTVISYFLILIAYLCGLYIFRYSEPEHLSSLSETTFLSFNYVEKNRSRKIPVFVLLSFLFCGILWAIFSLGVSILRVFALQLDERTTIIGWFTNNVTSPDQHDVLKVSFDVYNGLHYFFVIMSVVGFIFFDLLYIAVVINYCSQCQLLIYYINNIKDKIRNKKYPTLTEAAKELNKMSEFLAVLNSKISYITSLIFLIFLQNVIFSYVELAEETPGNAAAAALGFMNIIQWTIAAAFPVIMATWLTTVAHGVRRLGLQIAARPFEYSETPDLELDLFLNFTSSTNYVARLAFIPMYPSLVVGVVFVIVLLLTSHIVIPRIQSVPWF